MNAKSRFNVVPAGRRSGKTERAKRKLVHIAMSQTEWPDANYFAAAPTRDQAKKIYWEDLKKLVRPEWMAGEPRETDLVMKLITGASIHVVGMDKPQRIEGSPWNGGILDEFGNMKPQAWPENIRPALSDRSGWCDLIGVPEGRNHYWELAEKAMVDTTGEWGFFTWKSADILSASEIESAKSTLDEFTYRQEYEASFLNFAGRIYYCFERENNCSINVKYNPHLPIIFCFDFNVEPGVAAVLQEQPHLPCGNPGTAIIGEVYIPRNSNTVAVCNRLIKDWGHHKAGAFCYGDPAGGQAGTAKTTGNDWDIIRREMRPAFPDIKILVAPSHPRVRARVNAVNSRFRSGQGELEVIRMMVSPKCQYIIRDFEGVRCLEGGSGEIDKDADDKLTHLSDAIGYYIAYKYPVARGVGQRDI